MMTESEKQEEYWTEEEINEQIKALNNDLDYDPLIDAPRRIEFVRPGDRK